MVDSCIFIGAFEEGYDVDKCRAILDGAKQGKYMPYINTLILGEITKKLLKIKNEDEARYGSIYLGILDYLSYFKIAYIDSSTLRLHKEIFKNERKTESQDEINLSCAIANKCNLFITKDASFNFNKNSGTEIAKISDKNHLKLNALLGSINFR